MSKLKEQLAGVDGVQVRAIPMYSTINAGSPTECRILFQIFGGPNRTEQHKSINLCIVLDTSGSMLGASLDACKQALAQIVDTLRPTDVLHIVTFNDQVDTLCQDYRNSGIIDKATLLSKIDSITANGCTNLWQGLETGMKILEESSTTGVDKNSVKAIFLFSDGLANRGIVQPESIGKLVKDHSQQHNVNIVTFGIGNDFDEKLMASIARCGRGNYFYIDNVECVATLVNKAFDGLTNIIAEYLIIRAQAAADCKITSFGDTGQEQCYNILREYGFYQFMCTVQINPWQGDIYDFLNLMPVIKYTLEYNDVFGSLRTVQGSVEVAVVDSVNTREANPAVVCYDTMMECGKLSDKVTWCIKRSDITNAIAYKKQIIERYAQVENNDALGFITSLKAREEDSLCVLEKKGLCKQSVKNCLYASLNTPGSNVDRFKYEEGEFNDRDISFTLV